MFVVLHDDHGDVVVVVLTDEAPTSRWISSVGFRELSSGDRSEMVRRCRHRTVGRGARQTVGA
jgi:hypothetical protein